RRDVHQLIAQEHLDISPVTPVSEFEDDHGNTVLRLSMRPGVHTVVYDAITHVPSASEDFAYLDQPIPPAQLPAYLLRYTLPSRYCDSDKLRDFAWRQFSGCRHGIERIQAITRWVHENIEYRTGSGSPELSAYDV